LGIYCRNVLPCVYIDLGSGPPPTTARCLPQTPPHSIAQPQPSSTAASSYTPRATSSTSQTPSRKSSREMRPEQTAKVSSGQMPKPVQRLSLRGKVTIFQRYTLKKAKFVLTLFSYCLNKKFGDKLSVASRPRFSKSVVNEKIWNRPPKVKVIQIFLSVTLLRNLFSSKINLKN